MWGVAGPFQGWYRVAMEIVTYEISGPGLATYTLALDSTLPAPNLGPGITVRIVSPSTSSVSSDVPTPTGGIVVQQDSQYGYAPGNAIALPANPYAIPNPVAAPAQAAATIIEWAGLRAALGGLVGTAMRALAGLLGISVFRGTLRVAWTTWSRLPTPVKAVLGVMGATEGFDFIINFGDSVLDALGNPLGLGAGNNGVIDVLPDQYEPSLLAALGLSTTGQGMVVRVWNTVPANPDLGNWFVRLADGRGAARKKDGTWRIFRYPKMVVLPTTGAPNIRSFVRADHILERQAKRVGRALSNRGYQVRKKVNPKD